MRIPKNLLMASVSGIALAIAAPAAMAADLSARPAIASPPPPPSPWTWWIEGGGQAIGGANPYVFGFTTPAKAPAEYWGWNAAIGLDYRFDAFWHVSADFRYGQNGKRGSNSFPLAVFGVPTTGSPPGTAEQTIKGTNSANHDEYNWVADFMVGRDIGLGGGQSQLKFGIRVAEIRGKTTGSAAWSVPTSTRSCSPSTCVFTRHTVSYQQTNRFLGAGPRLAVEGSAPVEGAWFVDYMGGIAALYARRSVEQTATTGSALCLAGCPGNFNSASNGFVFNADGMVGVGYAFGPSTKLSLNYRVDAYFDALRVVNSSNGVTNVNRIYHGPNLRLTVQY